MTTFEGPPLAEEPGIGALTLPGFLAEVVAAHADREALVLHTPEGEVTRWSYRELDLQARAVARSLIAGGVGKGTRVGVLFSNRPEFLAAVFGIVRVGAVAVTLNTFSTPRELAFALRHADVTQLLMQRSLGDRDFLADLRELCPELAAAEPGKLLSDRFPFLRRVACAGLASVEGAVESWDSFLARGEGEDDAIVDGCAAAVTPADACLVMYSSGTTADPKGMLHGHRAAALQCWRFARYFGLVPEDRFWTPNGFFWSGNFTMVMGSSLAAGACIVLQETFEAGESLRLLEAERVTITHAWPHQLARLEEHPDWLSTDLSGMKRVDPARSFARGPCGRAPSTCSGAMAAPARRWRARSAPIVGGRATWSSCIRVAWAR